MPEARRIAAAVMVVAATWLGTLWGNGSAALAAEGLAWPPPDPQLARQWQTPVDWRWQGSTLRAALVRIAATQSVAIWRDRRIDPETELDLVAHDQPLGSALAALAQQAEGAISRLGRVVYLGPSGAALQLRTLASLRSAEAANLPAPLAAKLRHRAAWSWENLAQPRALAAQLATEAGLEIANPQALAHDLWAAEQMPPLALSDRLTLLGIGFGLTYQITADGVLRWVEIPDSVEWVASYPGGSSPADRAAQWRGRAPQATIEVADGQLRVRASVEAHELLLGRDSSPRRPNAPQVALPGAPGTEGAVRPQPPPADRQRYTIRVKDAPVGQLLAALAAKLDLAADWSAEQLAAQGVDLQRRVSIELNQADRATLLDECGQACGVELAVEGDRLTARITGSP